VRRVVYDAGVLIAADRSDRRVWAEHRARLERGMRVLVPTPVVAQVSRSPRQAEMRRLLAGCEAVPLSEPIAHRAGALLGRSKTTDVVDASVVALAIEHAADIVTGDREDIDRLVAASGVRLAVVDV
jgi:predicted nucleic acid-binding protein